MKHLTQTECMLLNPDFLMHAYSSLELSSNPDHSFLSYWKKREEQEEPGQQEVSERGASPSLSSR